MRLISAIFLTLTLGGCYFIQGEWGPGGPVGLGGQVDLSASQTTIRVGETVTLTLKVKVKDFEGRDDDHDGLIYSDQASSGPFDPEEEFEPLDPEYMKSEDVLQREPISLEGDSYIATFSLVAKRPGEVLIRGAFVYGSSSFYPTLYGDHGKVTITVTE